MPRASRREVTKASKISGSTSEGMSAPLSSGPEIAYPGSPLCSAGTRCGLDLALRGVDGVQGITQKVDEDLTSRSGVTHYAILGWDQILEFHSPGSFVDGH